MADFVFTKDDGSTETLDAAQLVERYTAPLRDNPNPTNADLNEYVTGTYASLANRHGFEVRPDVGQLRATRERYMKRNGYSPDDLKYEWDRKKAEGEVYRDALGKAEAEFDAAFKQVGAALRDAQAVHNREFGKRDSEEHGDEYERAIEELEAESSKLDARTRLRDSILAITDKERRAEWMQRYPRLFE